MTDKIIMCPSCKKRYNNHIPNNVEWDYGRHDCECGKQFKFYNEIINGMYS